jgi:hypothetical protein
MESEFRKEKRGCARWQRGYKLYVYFTTFLSDDIIIGCENHLPLGDNNYTL